MEVGQTAWRLKLLMFDYLKTKLYNSQIICGMMSSGLRFWLGYYTKWLIAQRFIVIRSKFIIIETQHALVPNWRRLLVIPHLQKVDIGCGKHKARRVWGLHIGCIDLLMHWSVHITSYIFCARATALNIEMLDCGFYDELIPNLWNAMSGAFFCMVYHPRFTS